MPLLRSLMLHATKKSEEKKTGNRNAFYVLVMLFGADFNLGSPVAASLDRAVNPQINATCSQSANPLTNQKNRKKHALFS